MKYVFGVLTIVILVGCATTESINGKYDLDKDYKARETIKFIQNTPELRAPVPEDESEESFQNKTIQKYRQELEPKLYDVEIQFPKLSVTITYPEKPIKTVTFTMRKVEENRYLVTKDNDPDAPEVNFTYDPDEKTLSSKITRYIKR